MAKNQAAVKIEDTVVDAAPAEATNDTGVTQEQGEAIAAEARKRSAAANFLPIVRGRLPLLFVHAVRFDAVVNAMSNKDLATKLATSVGKVFDIKKGRNFAYILQTFKPSADDITVAKSWIEQVGNTNAKGLNAAGDKAFMQGVLDTYMSAGLATTEEVAAFTATRGATRVKTERAPKAPGEAHTHMRATDAAPQAAAGSADDLLS